MSFWHRGAYFRSQVILIVRVHSQRVLLEFFLYRSDIRTANLLLDHLLWEAGMLFRDALSRRLTGVVLLSPRENKRWDSWCHWWAETGVCETPTPDRWQLVIRGFKILCLQPFPVPGDLEKRKNFVKQHEYNPVKFVLFRETKADISKQTLIVHFLLNNTDIFLEAVFHILLRRRLKMCNLYISQQQLWQKCLPLSYFFVCLSQLNVSNHRI